MRSATAPATDTKLLHVAPRSGALEPHAFADLPGLLRPDDLLVVNDAATIPASLSGHTERGEPLEIRLVSTDGASWSAIAFGAGDWRTRTEHRPLPPPLMPGDRLVFGDLLATVERVDDLVSRQLRVRFELDGDAFWSALYRLGRPVQYAHLAAALSLWDVQTAYASRPWAMEAPSAGLALTNGILEKLRENGIRVATVTEAAGLSSTGDALLDASLPWPERYDIPVATVEALGAARRVIAVGTTVVRALEASALEHGKVTAGEGVARLRLGPASERRVVDGILTGIHDPTASHYELLQAFAPLETLHRATDLMERLAWRGHEFGDTMLVLDA